MSPLPRGLLLGKFAPLHHGHQHVIDEALKVVAELVVLVYDTDLISVPLKKRAGWIRSFYPTGDRFPRVRVIECPDGPQETGNDPRIMKMQEDYVRKVLEANDLLPITHFFSSEWYGEHMSRSLNAIDARVDMNRNSHPISGTKIREWPFQWRRTMHPLVYRSLVKKIVFLGAESTGKSTMAEYMAGRHATQVMREYGREYWQVHNVNGRLTPSQLVNIACKHVELEERMVYESDRYLFVDTNAITTYMFAMHYHGSAEPILVDLAKKAETRYDLIFLCGDDMPYHDDGTREGDEHRHKFQKMIIDDLDRRGVRYTLLEGDLKTRMDKVDEILKGLK